MKQTILTTALLCAATANAGLFGGDSTTTTKSGHGGSGGSSHGGTGQGGHGGSSQGGNGGTGGGGGSVGGVKNVQAGNARGATNNAPIIVGPTADVINGKPRVVAGHYGSSVSLGGATGGSNRVSNNGNRAGNGGGSRGHSSGGSGSGGRGGRSSGGRGGGSTTGGGNRSQGGSGSPSFSPTVVPARRSLEALAAYLTHPNPGSLQARHLVETIRRAADPELFYNEVYTRDAEPEVWGIEGVYARDAEPDFEHDGVYARDAEPDFEYGGIYARDAEADFAFDDIYARDAEPEFESYFDNVYARDLHLMMMSS